MDAGAAGDCGAASGAALEAAGDGVAGASAWAAVAGDRVARVDRPAGAFWAAGIAGAARLAAAGRSVGAAWAAARPRVSAAARWRISGAPAACVGRWLRCLFLRGSFRVGMGGEGFAPGGAGGGVAVWAPKGSEPLALPLGELSWRQP